MTGPPRPHLSIAAKASRTGILAALTKEGRGTRPARVSPWKGGQQRQRAVWTRDLFSGGRLSAAPARPQWPWRLPRQPSPQR